MKKELSINLMEAMKAARKKAADLVDGQQVLTFLDGRLYLGTACRCDECPTVGTVNGGIVDAAHTSEADLLKLLNTTPFVLSNRLKADDVGCFDEDGSGDVLCSDCVSKRTAAIAQEG